jgi:hypothetical protein
LEAQKREGVAAKQLNINNHGWLLSLLKQMRVTITTTAAQRLNFAAKGFSPCRAAVRRRAFSVGSPPTVIKIKLLSNWETRHKPDNLEVIKKNALEGWIAT